MSPRAAGSTAEHERQYIGERRGEDLRLAYVGLTRARHQAVVWWAGSKDAANSPLGRLLFARDQDGNVAAYAKRTPSDATVIERFGELAEESGGQIEVERSKLGRPGEWISSLAEPRRLGHAEFDRRLDWSWRRTSYTDITAGAYEATVSSEPEETLVGDEPDAQTPAAAGVEPAPPAPRRRRWRRCPRAPRSGRSCTACWRLPTSRRWTSTPPWPSRSTPRSRGGRSISASGAPSSRGCAPRSRRRSVRSSAVRDLRDVPLKDRLDELEFELPLVGGDEPTGSLTLI